MNPIFDELLGNIIGSIEKKMKANSCTSESLDSAVQRMMDTSKQYFSKIEDPADTST